MKIEDIQYGLELGSDIRSKKEALWMTWRAWAEMFEKKYGQKPQWIEHYDGECSLCEYVGNYDLMNPCTECLMIDLWVGSSDFDFDSDYHDPCLGDDSPYVHWERGVDKEKQALIIANEALRLLKMECYQ